MTTSHLKLGVKPTLDSPCVSIMPQTINNVRYIIDITISIKYENNTCFSYIIS
jgi:hypothetical protein